MEADGQGFLNRLSEEVKEILLEAADQGEIVSSGDQRGRWIAAGSRYFVDDRDPSVAVRYREALGELVRKDLASHDEGNLHMLTSRGFKLARAVKQQAAPVRPS